MAQSLTIPADLPTEVSMNFNELRKEGIRHIQRLAGNIWTDYNIHDPGLTILEQLCLAITDIGYRIDLDMKTLLADSEQDPYRSLFGPHDILTTNPVTILDMRKLVLDVPGVKNAWVEKVSEYLPPFYYDFKPKELTLVPLSKDERIRLKGLYRVSFERENVTGLGDVRSEVERCLHDTRNLCEDFIEVRELPAENVLVQATIELGEVEDINQLAANILHKLANYVSPRINFYTLAQMLAKGKRIDEAMEGPLLQHGFVDSEELQQYDMHSQLYASDMIRDIMDVDGVLAVQDLLISSANDADSWVVDLDPGKAPRLDPQATIANISFVRDNLPAAVDADIAFARFKTMQAAERQRTLHDKDRTVLVDKEDPIDLASYDTVQNQFPINYGISELGLDARATPKRKAQAAQLKAYLVFFEQILANYFAQLAHVKDIYSFWNEDQRTYFFQDLLETVPGIEDVIIDKESYLQAIERLSETTETAQERKNRFLNHLMARFSEQFTDYSLLLYGVIQANEGEAQPTIEQANDQLIADKLAFLRDYPALSSGRGKSFNYHATTWDTDNVAGLKKRIGRMAGIRQFNRVSLAGGDDEGFHLVEHLLLRPRGADAEFKDRFLIFTWPFDTVEPGSKSGRIRIHSTDCAMQVGEFIEIHQSQHYNGSWEVVAVEEHAFEVKGTYTQADSGVWTRYRFKKDPFSLQLSFVFPGWIGRFSNPTYRQFIEKIIRRESPAHLTVYTLWMNQERFAAFEVAWQQFLQNLKTL